MSGSYRSILAALAGLAALLIVFGLGLMLGSSKPSEQRYQSYRYAADKPQEIDPVLVGQVGNKDLLYRTPCDDPKGQTESDLCAQWRAANAAEDSAFWTEWGFWIASVGSTLLLWQIILTRKAVKDTSEATDAMREANRIARDNADVEHRPWIAVTMDVEGFCRFTEKGFNIPVAVTIKNVGATPASGVHIKVEVFNALGESRSAPNPFFDSHFEKVGDYTTAGLVVVPNQEITKSISVNGLRQIFSVGEDGESLILPIVAISVVYTVSPERRVFAQTCKGVTLAELKLHGGKSAFRERQLVKGRSMFSPDQITMSDAYGFARAT